MFGQSIKKFFESPTHLKQANQFSLLLSEKVGDSAVPLSFLLMSQLNLTCNVCLLPPKRHCLAQSYFNQMKMIYVFLQVFFLKDGSCKVNGFHIYFHIDFGVVVDCLT